MITIQDNKLMLALNKLKLFLQLTLCELHEHSNKRTINKQIPPSLLMFATIS